jgi:DNA-binding NtrC family response regulator
LVYRPAIVRVVAGADLGASAALARNPVRVGSAPDNDLVLTDPHVSRYHAEFRVYDQGYIVQDLGSTNGTLYRGARVHEAVLGRGAEVRLGGSVLRVDVGDEVSEVVRGQQRFGRLVGVSPAMQEVYGLLAAVAPTDATVLILGETGTGKELAAEAIHRQSPPAQAPFQVLDCGAIPENLIESEFFGHEKGAFTGATQAREGVFERARGGTVFLDEIGELPQLLQTRLLRVLDRRQVKRVGGTSLRRVDVRLVAATNRDLRQEVEQGRFRQDLYYRLAVVCVVLPPLRQRREDIPLLARHFLWQSGCPDPDTVLTPDMLELLETRRWRGNVRELRNAIEEAVVLVDGAAGRQPQSALLQRESADEGPAAVHPPIPVQPKPVAAEGGGSAPESASSDDWLGRALPVGFVEQPYKEAKEQLLHRFERLYLSHLLEQHGENLSRLARDAGVDRQIIRRLLRRHGMGKA